jgi:CNP1-like family
MTLSRLATLVCLGFSLSAAWAQPDEPAWKEADVPPPPAFSDSRLVSFDVSPGSSLTFAVDEASIDVSRLDGVTRYVMVARSASGARNVFYEGIRCETAEVKTYARLSSEGQWVPVVEPEWKSLFDAKVPRHPLRLAKAGVCDGKTNVTIPREVARQLRSGPNIGNRSN